MYWQSSTYFRNDFFELDIRQGIIYGKFFCNYLTLSIAEQSYHQFVRITGGKPHLILSDCRYIRKIDKEARKFLAANDTPEHIKAGAILIKSPAQELMGNIFIYFNRPPIPACVFSDEEAAIKWLQKF